MDGQGQATIETDNVWDIIRSGRARTEAIDQWLRALEPQRPKALKQKHERPEVHPLDEALLMWFFDHGIAMFERSTFGAQLERAMLNARGSKGCSGCGGNYKKLGRGRVKRRVYVCPHCATGFFEPPGGGTPVPCGWCKGTRLLEASARSRRPDSYVVEDICTDCNGTGVAFRRGHRRNAGPLSARPGVISDYRPPVEHDPEDIRRYGEALRRFTRVSEHTAAILAAYYWLGQNHINPREGQLWPVMAATPAGKRLLRQYDERPKAIDETQLGAAQLEKWREPWKGNEAFAGWDDYNQAERFQIIAALPFAKTAADRNRRALLLAAREQAKTELAKAAAEWNATRPPKRRTQRPVAATALGSRAERLARLDAHDPDARRRLLEVTIVER